MSMRLRPSLVRACTSVIVLVAAVTAIAYFWQGYHEHYWWSRDHVLSMLIPFTIAQIAV